MPTDIDLEGIKARCVAATVGPWEWFGNTRHNEVYLATTHSGRRFIMDFARWGMSGAQPRFQVTLDGDAGGGIMRSLGDLGKDESPLGPKFEVSYRRQFVGIGHPDAQFIAHARTDVPALVARVEELERERDHFARRYDETTGALGKAGAETAKLRSLLREACGIATVYVDGYEHTKPAQRDAKRLAAIRAEGGIE